MFLAKEEKRELRLKMKMLKFQESHDKQLIIGKHTFDSGKFKNLLSLASHIIQYI